MESTNSPPLSNSLKRPKLWRRRSTLHVKKDHRERGKVSTGTSKHSSEVKALHSTMFCKVVSVFLSVEYSSKNTHIKNDAK